MNMLDSKAEFVVVPVRPHVLRPPELHLVPVREPLPLHVFVPGLNPALPHAPQGGATGLALSADVRELVQQLRENLVQL